MSGAGAAASVASAAILGFDAGGRGKGERCCRRRVDCELANVYRVARAEHFVPAGKAAVDPAPSAHDDPVLAGQNSAAPTETIGPDPGRVRGPVEEADATPVAVVFVAVRGFGNDHGSQGKGA
jgi:hypothetical protein